MTNYTCTIYSRPWVFPAPNCIVLLDNFCYIRYHCAIDTQYTKNLCFNNAGDDSGGRTIIPALYYTEKTMKKLLRDSLRLLRPRQWVKNFAIFASLIFSGLLFDPSSFTKVFWGFIAFCLLSSAIYIINDIIDIPKDRLHPFKRFRPFANKDIPISLGIIIAVVFAFIALLISSNISILATSC